MALPSACQRGDLWLKNATAVVLHLKAERKGLAMSLGADAVTSISTDSRPVRGRPDAEQGESLSSSMAGATEHGGVVAAVAGLPNRQRREEEKVAAFASWRGEAIPSRPEPSRRPSWRTDRPVYVETEKGPVASGTSSADDGADRAQDNAQHGQGSCTITAKDARKSTLIWLARLSPARLQCDPS